ncbi:MAG: peptidylprolyl isomerase [Croceibacterium sp.]
MLQFFRNFMKSKLGVGVTLGFLVLLALAFASSDVASNNAFGGVAGGDRAAVVGERRVSTSELSQAATNSFEQQRQRNPTMTMAAFVAQGGLKQALDQLLSRTVLAEFARENGLRAGKRLIDSELAQIPAFQGPDGKFNRQAFESVLGQRQLSEATVREDFATNLLARQLVSAVAIAPAVPRSFGLRYAALLREHRTGAIAVLPSALFAPAGDPTEAQLQAFYQQQRTAFIRPERRVIRYATFTEAALGTLPAPTDAQIAQRYQRDQAKYAASENRTFTQLVVPTEAAAKALEVEVRGGKALAAAALAKGLRTVQVGPINQAAFGSAASATVATAGFSGAPGSLTAPARGGLGWYILHIDKVERQQARTAEQARGEIVAGLAKEQRAAALADLTARIEAEFDDGKSLADVAKEQSLTVEQSLPATADGRIYGQVGKTIPPLLGRVLATAFQMEEGQPQLAGDEAGQQFVIFDVPAITASAVAPLADIRTDVVALWRKSEGAKAARAAADAVLARVAAGASLADATRTVKPGAPAAKQLDLNREQLARIGRVPPELALFFSMAKGTTKKLEATGAGGWYVVRLDNVEAGQIAPNDPLLQATIQQLASVGSEEYVAQFIKAAEAEVGVKRNAVAIAALEAQLSGRAPN